MENALKALPENVKKILLNFVDTSKSVCATNLKSVVLYGSAAEGRLRLRSDVNLILVLNEYQVSQVNDLREKLRLAHAAINLNVMFLLNSEIKLATEAFAVKFTDILNRHVVLYGEDVFASLNVSRNDVIQRLKQVLLNLTLRLRERYALVSLREEQLEHVIVDVAGPLRACAVTILSLEGKKALYPKEALIELTRRLSADKGEAILASISAAREEKEFKIHEAENTVLGLLDLLQLMQKYVQELR